jgi:hypothetical protein
MFATIIPGATMSWAWGFDPAAALTCPWGSPWPWPAAGPAGAGIMKAART